MAAGLCRQDSCFAWRHFLQPLSVLVRRASGGSRPLSARLVFCLATLPTAAISACEKGQQWQQAFVGKTRVLPGAASYSRDQCL